MSSSQSPATYFLAPYQGQRPPAPAWFEEVMTCEPERTFIQSSGANIELLTWGRVGAPGLLFLHGNGAHADWWAHIAPFFAADWRCAALSYSGMGRSDWRADGYTTTGFAAEALDAVIAAGLDQGPQPPVIVGHSFGGTVGMELAAHDHPFRGMILIDTPVNLDSEKISSIRARAPKSRREHQRFTSLEEGLARFRLSPQQDCENEFIGDYIARCALIERNGTWSWRFDPRRFTLENRQPATILKQVRCPIAFIHGERSALIPCEDLELHRAVLPAGTPVITIPDAAHHVLIDQPLALVASLRALFACWPPVASADIDTACNTQQQQRLTGGIQCPQP